MGQFWAALLGGAIALISALMRGRKSGSLIASTDFDPTGDLAMSMGGVQPAAALPPMWVQAKAQIESLRKSDPNFSESAFLTQAARLYAAALTAEGAMNADALGALATPHFLTSFRTRLSGWTNAGFTRVVSDLKLDPPLTFKVASGASFQSITVRFTGTARRFTREDTTNVIVDGAAEPESFSEFATFVRAAGSTTPPPIGTGGNVHCPSCGAPLQEGASRCAFCGAAALGTGGTWLLDRISASAYT